MSRLITFDFNGTNISSVSSAYNGAVSGGSLSSTLPPALSGKSVTLSGTTDRVLLPFPIDQAGKTLFWREHFYLPNNPVGDIVISSLWSSQADTGNSQISVRLNYSSRKLQLYRGGTLLATGNTSLQPGWHILQHKCLVHSSAGLYEVKINGGAADISFAGNTQNQATNNVVAYHLGADFTGAFTGIYNIYGVIFNNSDGTVNNGHVSTTEKYLVLAPISDSANIWTPSTGATAWNLLDDLFDAPNDTDLVSTSTLNAVNDVVLTAIPGGATSILAVELRTRALKSAVGSAGIKVAISDGTNQIQSAEITLNASANNYFNVSEFKTGTTPFATTDTLHATTQLTSII